MDNSENNPKVLLHEICVFVNCLYDNYSNGCKVPFRQLCAYLEEHGGVLRGVSLCFYMLLSEAVPIFKFKGSTNVHGFLFAFEMLQLRALTISFCTFEVHN